MASKNFSMVKQATPIKQLAIASVVKDDKKNTQAKNTTVSQTNTQQNQKWYAGDTPTWRESIGRAYQIAETDRDRGQKAYNDLQYLKNDPNSRYYRYYASATNGAIKELENLGFDTRLLQQEGFFDAPETRSFINNNLERSGTTNSPKSPTKKTSTNGRISYWLTQYQAAMEDTQNAKAEKEKIENKAKTLAGWKGRNYSDEEIFNEIYGKDGEKFKKDYPTLYQMEHRSEYYKPLELNEAVDFTKDLLYGATWLGRNPEYDGKIDLEQAMALSYMGKGNVWKENPEIASKIEPLLSDNLTVNPNYAPYSVGSSNLDDAVVHFNTYSFTDDWIAQNQHLLYDGTEEEKKLMKQIVEGNQNYHSATEALDALSVWEKKKLSKETNPAEAKSKLDALLEKGYLYIGTGKNEGKIFSESGKDRKKVDLGILNKMDVTMGKGDSLPSTDLLPMSQGVDYKYDNYVSHLNDLCSQNASVPNETSTVNDIAKETSAPYAALKAPAKAKGAELPENMPEAAQAPAAAAGITPITEAEQEQIEAQNKKIREAADLTEGIASDNETAVMRNSGSVAFNRVKESFGTMRTFPALVEGFSKTAINMGTTDVLNESLDSVHDISEYMTVQSNYESDSATYAEYEAKYGPVEYLMKPFEKEKTVQVGDFNVSMEYLFSGTENNRPGYVITNIAAPERGGGLFYDDIVSYAESGIEWAIEAMQEAEKAAKAESSEAFKILEAQNNMLGQKNGEKEVEEYKNLVPKMQNEKEYLDSNEAKNKEQQAVIQKSVEKLNMMYEAATLLGQDTTQIDKAFDFLESMVQFHDEPQLPVQEMGKLEYIDEIGKTYGKQFTMHEKRKMIHDSLDSIDQQIKEIENNIAYADETGYQIPGRYEQNMQYKLDDLQMEKKAFEYAAIITDTDPDELRAAYEAGKAFEKKFAKDMVTWQGMFGTEDNPEYYYTLGEKQTAVTNDDGSEYKFITDDDRIVYYYLLGKKVQELGGELDRLWEGQKGNKGTAAIRDAVTEILKDADDFVEYMNDKDYGIWTTKRAINAGKMGQDLVNSGWVGGLAANLAATAISPFENIANAGYTIDQLLTGGRFNRNAPARAASLFKQGTREETIRSIEEKYENNPVAKWLAKTGYEVYCNSGDSAMNAVLSNMFMPGLSNPILNEFVGSLPMGFTAGVDAAMEAVENGANTEQAWLILGTTIAFEAGSETITRKNILEALGETGELTKDTIKNATIDWLTRTGIEEMIGETATEALENWMNEKAAEWIDNPNFKSDHEQLIEYYLANGAASREEAEAKAYEQEVNNLIHTAFVSYVGAGTHVLGRIGKAAWNTARSSKDIVNGYRVYTKGRQQLGYGTSMLGYMAQDLKTAITRNNASGQETARQAASGQEASVAVPANEEQDESAKQAATDVLAIGRVQKSNATTQTEMVASILDNGDGGETASEQANAAATFLNNVFGEDTSYIVQQCVMGTVKSGISRDIVTTALQNAAMGNGAATAIVQSESFLQATPEQKAQMLADTVEADQGNPDVQQSIADHVKDYRMGTGISELAAQGHFDQAQADQDAADRAAAETTKADAQLEEKQEMLEAATKDLQQKSEDVNREASDDNTKQQADAATRVSSADESVRQYEQHKEKAEAVQKEAEAKAAKSKQDAMTSARETVGQNMEAVNQQRTEAAQQKAEADRIAAEEQAEAARQAQAEEDERTGKADDDRRNALIEEALDRENLQGEKRETRREQLKKQLDKVKIKITDLGKSVSNTEGRLALYAFERKLGVPIVFDDLGPVNSKHITRGQYVYNEETGEAKIVINENLIKAGKMTVGQAIVEAALHEVLHSVRATGAYNTYRHVVTEALYGNKSNLDPTELYKQNIAYRAAIDDMIADRKAAGDKNFQDDVKLEDKIKLADEEIVADFARLNLADKDVVQRFMDAGMGGRMRNTLHNINQALKNYGEKLSGKRYQQWKANAEQQNREIEQWNTEHPDQQKELINIQSQEEFNKNLEYLRRAERAYQKAMNEAAKTNIHPNSNMMSVSQIAESTKLGMVVNDDTLELYMPSENGDIIGDGNNGLEKGKRYVLMDGVTPGRKITADMIVNTPVGMLIDMGLDNTEFTDEQGNKRTQQGDARQMFADLMNLCARYKDNNLIWEIAGSEFSEAFSALKSNSDPQYKNTVDFGTICSKTQAIVDVLSQTMIDRVNTVRQWNEEHAAEIEAGKEEAKVFTGLTREDIMEVYDRTHNAGLSVPCPVCYVFSRWMGVPGMLGQMNRFQHEYVSLAKGEDGKTLYDENGDAVVNWDETFDKANSYLLEMVQEYTKTKDNPNGIDITDTNLTTEERNAAIKAAKDKIADQKNSINNKIRSRQKSIPKLYEEIGILQEKLEKQDLTDKQRQKIEEQIQKKQDAANKKNREIDQFEEDKKKFEAFNWVSQVLCLQHTEGRSTINNLDENGNFVMDKENFRYTPEEILFDLNRSGEFAGYAKNWRYRTTRGAGMGKAIMPYSGASIGDLIHGEAIRWKQSENPLLQMDRASAEKAFKNAQKRVKQQNLVGGQRFQSTSDFRPEWGLDYIMSFLEMQALGSKVQMYTKVAEAVDFLGSIGADVNLSIMAKNNGFHEATAEEIALANQDTDEGRELKSRMGTLDGKTYVMEFSDVTGMDYATAKEKSKKFNNVQMILVGMNDVHIRLALGNQDIDFVIPWHSSGNSKDVLQQLVSSVGEELMESSDYTDSQTDQIKSHKEGKGKKEKTIDDRTEDEIKLWDARVKLLTEGGEALTQDERKTLMSNDITRELYRRFTEQGYDPDCYGVTLTKDQAEQVFPYEYWDKTSTRENADVNGQRFVAYCDALGLVPRFSQFKNVPGYWKLLIDRKMYDNNVLNEDGTVKEYGKYREQKVVDVTKARMDNNPNQALDPATDRKKQVYQLPESTTAKYGRKQYKQETENAIRAANEYLSEKYDGHTKNSMYGDLTAADRDLMTDANNDYEDAVARKDWKAAQEDVDFYAEQKGYTYDAFHGSPVANITSFDKSKLGNNTGSTDVPGFFFVDRRDYAEAYLAEEQEIKPEYKERYEEAQAIYDQYHDQFSSLNGYYKIGDHYGEYVQRTHPEKFKGFYDPESQEYRDFERASAFLRNVDDDRLKLKPQYTNTNKQGKVYGVKLKMQNPYVYDANGEAWTPSFWGKIKQAAASEGGFTYNGGIYDGIIVENFYDFNTGESGTEYVVFNPEQIKSSDPVTYDDNGNVIPLDQRFTDSPDIRYSAEGELTKADRDLMSGRVSGMINGSVGYEAKNGYIKFDNAPTEQVIENLKTIGMIYDATTRTWNDNGPRRLSMDTIVKAVEDGNNGIAATVPQRPQKQRTQKQTEQESKPVYNIDPELLKDMELNQYMVDRGIITPEELAAYQEKTGSRPLEGQNPTMSTAQGPAQRAFGDADGMLRNSDEIAGFAKAVVEAQNSYFPDTNNEQVHRAINWIRSLKQTPNSDGFAEALNAVTKDDFDYRSADGQARMVAVMGMAVARKDTMAQVALADAFNRQGTDLGRALQARKLFKLMTPAGRISTLQKMIDNYNVDLKKNGDKEITFSHWIYEAAADAETSEDFHKVLETAAAELATQLPISWKERLNSLRMLSMLANPRTHIRNIVGNALFVPAVGMKNKIGALLEKAFVKKGERTKTLAPVLNSEIREFARQDARTMKDTLTGEAKYDENTLVQQAKNPLGPVLGVLSDVNSRFLEGEDWLFLRGHYRRALGGWMQANGYTVDQVKNDKALLEKGREYAIQEAQKATYRDFNGVAQKLNQIARDAKTPGQKGLAFLVNAVLPFKKTPANILKRGIEYSPLGVARSVYNLGKKFRGGDVSATQVIDQFTSGLSGTAVMALGFLLAGTGAVSCGFGDEDWPEELKGKQKYSINPNAVLESLGIPRLFGEDVTYTMDWAAPMAMPFFVGASIRSQTDQEGWDANKVLDAMSSISEPVFNLSMLDGVNSLFKINSYSNQNPATQIGAKIVSNYMSSYVPSVLGAIARTLDDTQRKSYVKKEDKKFLDGVFNYAWETAENKIPGQSQNNIPVRDVWGNAKTSDLAERIIENWISPGYIEHIQDDSVVNELGRLFDSTHSKYLVPEHADQTIDGKGLEAEVYDTYDRVHGETQYSMLKELFDSKEYQEMTDDDAKVEMVRNIYSYAKKVARGAIDEDYWYEKQAVSEMIQDGKTTDYKAKMMQCIEDGNWEGYENYVEALREEGVEDSSIKSKINSKYSGQWKDAYRKYLETGNEKYSDRMAEIEELLESTGYEFNIYGNKGWEEKVDQEFQ